MKRKVTANSPAALLRQCREASGHRTIYAAAKTMPGVSLGTMHRIEAGEQDPSFGCLAAVLERMGWALTITVTKRGE